MDLRNTKLLEAILKTVEGFNETNPTFLLSEVVLTYMAVNRLDFAWLKKETGKNVL